MVKCEPYSVSGREFHISEYTERSASVRRLKFGVAGHKFRTAEVLSFLRLLDGREDLILWSLVICGETL